MRVRVTSGFGTQIYSNYYFKKLINETTHLTSESSFATVLSQCVQIPASVQGFVSHLSERSSVPPALLLQHCL